MRMAELSRATGVPVPTIKYYIREGLVPGGERTSRNQARYGSAHVRRLRLIRALADHGGLSIATIKELLDAAEDPDMPVDALLGAAQKTVTTGREAGEGPHWDAAAARTAELLDRHGWSDYAGHPAVQGITALLATFYELDRPELVGVLDAYADATKAIAAADLDAVGDAADRAHAVEVVVIGTLLGDALIALLRRIAQADRSRQIFGADRATSA